MGDKKIINGWEKFYGSRVKLVFDDGSKITIKFGILNSISQDFIFICGNEGEEAVNKSKVVRVEKC